MSTLPEDLVSNILERLPAKSLMRFKCIQRSWNALFKTNFFMKRQMQRQSEGSDEHFMIFASDTYMAMLSSCEDPFRKGTCFFSVEEDPNSLSSCNESTLLQHQDLQPPFPDKQNYYLKGIRSLGHCNGVFCLQATFRGVHHRTDIDKYFYHKIEIEEYSFDDDIYETIMWNPATREIKVVPLPPNKPRGLIHPPLDKPSTRNVSRVYNGFGVDPTTFNDFKMIKLYLFFKESENVLLPSAELYNLSTDSWTVIHDLDIVIDIMSSFNGVGFIYSIFASGVCYWLSLDLTFILCFDFRYNQFQKLSTPSIPSIPSIRPIEGASIVEAGDSIAYIVHGGYLNWFHIWILKQHTWIKKCIIEPLGRGVAINLVWKDGAEFLGGHRDYSLVSYNSKAQQVRKSQVPSKFYDHIHRYVESIIPLSSG